MKHTPDDEGHRPQETAKINASSLPPIRDALNRERDRLRPSVRPIVDGRPLERAHLINAYVLWVLAQPEARRNEISLAGCDMYRTHIQTEGPVVVAIGNSVTAGKPLQARGALGPGGHEGNRQGNDNVVPDLRLPGRKK